MVCRQNGVVSKLYLFGSALTPRFNPKTSDVDVFVETAPSDPEKRGEQLIMLWNGLEAIFGRKVDLLTENSLRNPYLKHEINQTKKLIYDAQNEQIPL